MKGDFSRRPGGDDSDPAWQAVSALWLQQGRPLLDADINLAMSLHRRQLAEALALLIGPVGGPESNLGFAVSPECSLSLNEGEGGGRQALWLRPHGRAETAPAGELDLEARMVKSGATEDLVVTVSIADRVAPSTRPIDPETWHLRLRVPAGAAGSILARPGHYVLRLATDRSVLLEQAGTRESHRIGQLAPDAWCELAIAEDSGRLHLRLGEQPLVALTAGPRPAGAGAGWVLAADHPRAVASVGAALLPCRVAVLRAWPAFLDVEALTRNPDAGDAQFGDPSFELDTTRIVDDGTGRGRMNNRAPAADHRHSPATLSWSGAPPRLRLERYRLSKGLYFIDGMPCRNAFDVGSDAQPFPPPPESASASELGSHLVHLDAWEREVDALDDPSLADQALQGADTVIRQETVWQVRTRTGVAPLSPSSAAALLAPDPHGRLAIRRTVSSAPRQGNGLLRVEIHHPGWTHGPTLTATQRAAVVWGTVTDPAARIVAVPGGALDLAAASPVRLCLSNDGDNALLSQVVDVPAAGQWQVAALPVGSVAGCRIGLLPIASFKWSRNNGAASFPVASVQSALDEQGHPAVVALLSSPGLNGFGIERGDWLEWVDPQAESMGRPGPFLRVQARQEDILQVVLAGWSGPLPFVAPASGGACRLRLWSHRRHWHVPTGEDAPPADAPWPRTVTGADVAIDAGLHLRFAPEGRHRRGDHWTATLREDSLDIVGWPSRDGQPLDRAPEGPRHRVAPLAVLHVADWHIHATDLRQAFKALVEGAGATSDAGPPFAALERWAQHWKIGAPPLSESPAAWLERVSDAAPAAGTGDFVAALARWAHAWTLSAPMPSVSPTALVDRIMRPWLQAQLHAGDLRLLARRGSSFEGFEDTGEFVASRCIATARWHRLEGSSGAAPRAPEPRWPAGPGQAVAVGAMAFFVGGGGRMAVSAAPFGRWRDIENLGQAAGAALAVHRDSVLLAGGHASGSGLAHGKVVRIHPIGLVREHVGELAQPVTGAAAVVLGDVLYVIGGIGRDGRSVATVQALSLQPPSGRWFGVRAARGRVCARLPSPRADLAAAAWGDAVIVAGGRDSDGRPIADVLLLNPALGTFVPRAALPHPRYRAGAAIVPEGLVLAGGIGADGRPMAEVLLYRPQRNGWQVLAPLPRSARSVALLAEPETFSPDGARLIALGGADAHGDIDDAHSLALVQPLAVLSAKLQTSTP